MELRKVQVTGGSTYVVSLPKRWAVDAGIKPNDTVGLLPLEDGTLVITPKIVTGEVLRTKTFEVGERTKAEALFRDLIAAYVTGYNVIEVHQRLRMSGPVRNVVRSFCQAAIGPEIIDETADSIRTRDLLDPSDLPFRTSLQRMHRIASGMHSSAAVACAELDTHLAEDVVSRDAEVDRLQWLVARQHSLLLRDVGLVEKMGTAREHAIYFLLISRIIERIADHAARIARHVPDLKRAGAETKLLAGVTPHSETAMGILEDAMVALLTKDAPRAHGCIDRTHDFLEEIEKLGNRIAGLPGDIALPLGTVVDSLERTGHYTKDVAEIVINYLVGASDQPVKV